MRKAPFFYSKPGNFEILLQENHVRPPSSFCT